LQRRCLFAAGDIEPLGEPEINASEEIAGFGPPALPGHRRAGLIAPRKFPGFPVLPARNLNALVDG
jgi:hypothetical protein